MYKHFRGSFKSYRYLDMLLKCHDPQQKGVFWWLYEEAKAKEKLSTPVVKKYIIDKNQVVDSTLRLRSLLSITKGYSNKRRKNEQELLREDIRRCL